MTAEILRIRITAEQHDSDDMDADRHAYWIAVYLADGCGAEVAVA